MKSHNIFTAYKYTNLCIFFFLCISECVFGTGQMKATAHNVKLTSAQNMVARYVAKMCLMRLLCWPYWKKTIPKCI